MKTREEVDELKNQWRKDPCWDLAETKGFSDYRKELAAYERERRESWSKERLIHCLAKAEAVGCPGNSTLGSYLLALEKRIEDLEEKLRAQEI